MVSAFKKKRRSYFENLTRGEKRANALVTKRGKRRERDADSTVGSTREALFE